jgi:hypothetical protein
LKGSENNSRSGRNNWLPIGATTAFTLAFGLVMFGMPAGGSVGRAAPGYPSIQKSPAEQNPPAESQEKDKKPGVQEVPVPLPRGKKLVLKDGSYQIVRSYERKDDRVRYYSLERSAWEEIPTELVDWDATAKAETDDAKKKQETEEKVRAREAAERAADVEVGSSIEILPGIFLPEAEGIYAVQDKMILPLTQTVSALKLSKGQVMKQILVPVPIIPTKQTMDILGKHAVLRLTTPQPEFYFRTADAREPEMELIHATVKGDKREVAVILSDPSGNSEERRKYIIMQRWPVAKGVYRFTVSETLAPGEYALGEILAEGMNMYLWDFGIDPPGTPPVPGPKPAEKPKSATQPKPKPRQ